MQLAAGLKVPVPSSVKLTLPVGVLLVPLSMSLTVAVQLVELSTGVVDGEQLTLVLVARVVTVTAVLPLLVACLASPL